MNWYLSKPGIELIEMKKRSRIISILPKTTQNDKQALEETDSFGGIS
jgi:hypothetical protein